MSVPDGCSENHDEQHVGVTHNSMSMSMSMDIALFTVCVVVTTGGNNSNQVTIYIYLCSMTEPYGERAAAKQPDLQ